MEIDNMFKTLITIIFVNFLLIQNVYSGPVKIESNQNSVNVFIPDKSGQTKSFTVSKIRKNNETKDQYFERLKKAKAKIFSLIGIVKYRDSDKLLKLEEKRLKRKSAFQKRLNKKRGNQRNDH